MATALVVVTTLFYLMQYLVATGDAALDESATGSLLEFIRVEEPEVINRKEPFKRPPLPEDPPPEPMPPDMQIINPDVMMIPVTATAVSTGIELEQGDTGLGGDDEYLPIVKVRPIYPSNALVRGIEGYVLVEFTVTREGTVQDIEVVESEPEGVFDRAAIQAAAKFKYRPRFIHGEAIEVTGVRNRIAFEIGP
jgi:protein TonB